MPIYPTLTNHIYFFSNCWKLCLSRETETSNKLPALVCLRLVVLFFFLSDLTQNISFFRMCCSASLWLTCIGPFLCRGQVNRSQSGVNALFPVHTPVLYPFQATYWKQKTILPLLDWSGAYNEFISWNSAWKQQELFLAVCFGCFVCNFQLKNFFLFFFFKKALFLSAWT